jgi:hypothetical protein
MAADHGFISPPDLGRVRGPGGHFSISARWVSSPVPPTRASLRQTSGTYSAWYKGEDAWRAPERLARQLAQGQVTGLGNGEPAMPPPTSMDPPPRTMEAPVRMPPAAPPSGPFAPW